MLANRSQLGTLDFARDIGSFLTAAFLSLFETLASVVNIPVDVASSGAGLLLEELAALLVNVPIIGVVASEVLLLGKAVLQWGLSVPGLLLENIVNIFGEIKNAIDATTTPDEQKKNEAEAKNKILDRAQQKGSKALRNAVEEVLDGNTPDATGVPVQKTDLPAAVYEVGVVGKTDVEKVLEIGIPISIATALVFLVLT